MIAALLLMVSFAPADPFPILRVPLDAGERPPASAGVLSALTQAQFDAKLGAAQPTVPPRMLTASYRASLVGTDLVGDGLWRIRADRAGPLSLQGMNIALADPKWDMRDTVLDRTAGATRLWVDEAESSPLSFDWSARGREEPGMLHFDLRLPAAPIATVTLDLPSGRGLSVGDALLRGPLPSEKPNTAQWQISCGGKSRLELVLSQPAGGAVLASRSARYNSNEATAVFDFELEALRGPVAAWIFAVDPEIRVLDVVTPNRDAWHFDAVKREVTVTLREPAQRGRASITAALSLPSTGLPWSVPRVHSPGAMRDDSLEFRIGSPFDLAAWEAGDYVLIRSAALVDRDYSLVFRGSWRSGETTRKPPSLTLRPTLPILNLSAALDWRLSETSNRAAVTMQCTALHGPMTRASIKLPTGYTAGAVRFSPDDPGAMVTATPTTLTVEPSKPWAAGQTVEMLFELRGASPTFESHRAIILAPSFAAGIAATRTITIQEPLRFEDPEWRSRIPDVGDATVRVTNLPAVATPPVTSSRIAIAWEVESQAAARVEGSGVVRVVLTGIVRQAAEPWMPIAVPAGAIIETVTVGGRWVDARNGDTVRLPVHSGAAFEVRYRLDDTVRGLMPATPVAAPSVLGQIVLVEWSAAQRLLVGSASRPRLLHPAGGMSMAVVAAGALFLGFRVVKRIRLGRAAVGIVMVSALTLTAQPTGTATVYTSRDGTVYVSQVLLDRLAALALHAPPAAFTAAAIRSHVDDASAYFEIELTLHLQSDAEQTVVLPLRGVALESATLDGEAALPVATSSRLALPVRGAGTHTVVLRGRTPLLVEGADREAVFPLDSMPIAHLHLSLDATARSVSVPNREGALRVDRSKDGLTVDADLGAAAATVVRWRIGGLGDQPKITASSATLWDIAPGETAVTAAFAINILGGSVSRLAFEIPTNLEPGQTVIRAAGGPAVGVREGTLSPPVGGRRTYAVLLQEPLEGVATVLLKLVPDQPLTASPSLANVKLEAASASTSFVLLRSSAGIDRWDRNGFSDSTIGALQSELGMLPEFNLERSPVPMVFRQDRADGVLRPFFPIPGLPRPAREDLSWTIGAKATLAGTTRFARDVALSAVEFEVPAAVTLLDVAAAEIAGWSRQGGRVRVWLRTPQKEVVVRWSAHWPGLPSSPEFDLPMPSKRLPWRIVRLRDDGLKLKAVGAGWRSAIAMAPRQQAWIAAETPLRITRSSP